MNIKINKKSGRYFDLELGQYYDIRFNGYNALSRVKLIRTSPKGFNFLNEKTNKCIYPTARCASGYAGKKISKKEKYFKIFFPSTTTDIIKN